MKKRASFLLISLGIFWVSSAFAQVVPSQAPIACPDVAKKETLADCPWVAAARAISTLQDPAQIRNTLNEKLPGFINEIDLDSKAKDLVNVWGLSQNLEETLFPSGPKLIPENLLRFVVNLWQAPYNDTYTEGNAGLNHTYGYLFSTVPTSHGYKRNRYTQGEIEEGLGLPAGLFSGIPTRGTLFTNFTKFIGTIAFRDNAASAKELSEAQDSGKVTKITELENYSYKTVPVKRLVEIAKNDRFYLEMRTDVVMFTKPNTKGKNTALLIYSIDFHSQGQAARPRLINAFPVDNNFVTAVFNPAGLGEGVQLKLKYNAALPVSIPASDMIGKRLVANEGN